MACNNDTSSCQSSCYKHEDNQNPSPKNNNKTNEKLCFKCKSNQPMGVGGGDVGRFCGDCFRSNVYGKFRLAVTSHAMITPSDNVLVAFSGGVSSRAALQFMHDLHYKAQKNFDACRDRSLAVFGVGVAFIDESALHPVPSDEIGKAIEEMRSIVSNLAPPAKQFHVVPIESIYSSGLTDNLKDLLNHVTDTTGKEDLILHLRMLCLQKIAAENGYNRIVLGLCTSRIACHVLSATVKGRGYSLPADIQHVDARWEAPVVLPLRDCLAEELNTLCRLDGFGSLKTVEVLSHPCNGINGLVSSFVKSLQVDNPSRECTIVRTAAKLIPFEFNKIPEIIDGNVPLSTIRRIKKFNLKTTELNSSETFCPICNSPLTESELLSMKSPASFETNADCFRATCCSSCQFQILPEEAKSMEQLFSLLPQLLVSRARTDGNSDTMSSLREQIQDCLLSDDEDET
ncbi:hypothetical protein ACFE04_030551 [Oxalis oulophora]